MSAAPGPTRRERRKQACLETLVAAAWNLFCAQGFDAASIDQVCDAADVAKGTFFNYFPSKEDALVAGFLEFLAPLSEAVPEALEGVAGASEQMVRVMRHVAEHLSRQPALSQRAILEIVYRIGQGKPALRFGPSLENREVAFQDLPSLDGILERLLDEARAAGEMDPSVARESALCLLRSVFNQLLLCSLGCHPPEGIGDIMEATVRTAIRGLRPACGKT